MLYIIIIKNHMLVVVVQEKLLDKKLPHFINKNN